MDHMTEKTNVGVVGYGYWGPNLLRNYMQCPDAQVKWVCDRDGDRLSRAQGLYPDIEATREFSDVIGDPDTDAVVIATPVSTHHPLARQALLAGKHVFVEKPMTASTAHAEELVDIAESRNLTLMTGHTFEYSPPVIKIKEIIDSGELGEIYFIASSRVNLGLHQRDVSVIWDLAPHDFSILFYWLGEEPMNIAAHGRSCLQDGQPDVAFVNLAFPSGAVAELQLSWLSPVKLRRTLIVGSRKMLLYDDTESVEKIKVFDHGVDVAEPGSFGEYQLQYRTGDIVSPRIDTYEPLSTEANHFITCVREGCRPKTDGHSGLRVVRALEKAEESLQWNRRLYDCGASENRDGWQARAKATETVVPLGVA